MKKFPLALSAAALAIAATAAGVVYAQQDGAMHRMHGMHADPFGDATITRADAQAKASALFATLDLNHDGKLDKADRAVRIGERFDKMDTNHDGVLSKQEFIAAHEQAMGGHEGREGGPRHEGPEHSGPDHDGMGHEGMGHAMPGMDANGDHAISRDEFIGGALKRFDAADANHDGKLTKDERRAAFRAHWREMREGMQGGMQGPDDGPPPPAGQ